LQVTASVAPRWAKFIAAMVPVVATPLTDTRLRAQQDTTLGFTAVRFYRAAGPETLVEVFCRIPLATLAPLAGGSREAAYRVAVSVRDSSGLELWSRSWSQIVAWSLVVVEGASSAEHFQFAARPGRYGIEVAVTDSASGRLRQLHAGVTAYAARPHASDLLVAGAVRRAGAGDTTPRSGELRKGALFLETSGWPVATPEHAQLGYYLELYAQRPETASVAAQVLDAAGKQYAATDAQQIALPVGGGAATAMLDLSGLPPGDYRLKLIVETRDSQVVREASFGMTGFGRRRGVAPSLDPDAPAGTDTLAALPEAKLDSMYAPLVYLLGPDERGVYRGLTADGKRTFLRQFWKRRDPRPGTARNEAEDEFYRTVAEADRRFREGGGAAVRGWRTDRGRIFIRYGPPDEVLDRGQAEATRPYEVWKYTKGKRRKFVFVDSRAFGNYELIWTDERGEPSRPDWQEELGPAAVQDVQRF
jgi:GWxTD domain-containing protein